MNYLFRSVFNVNHFLGKKRFLIAFITTMMLFNFNSGKAQSLVDNVTVNLTDVTWNLYCADGTDLGILGCAGNDGPDPRFRFRIGWDGGNFSTYRHLGASNSPQTGGPTLDNESDTDGASVNSINFRAQFTNQCITTINFDLDAWEEDIENFTSLDCPSDGNYVYNSSYSLLCTAFGDGDDSRATSAPVYNVPNSNGSQNVTYNLGAFSMTFNIARTIVAAPTVTTVPADRLVCSGGTVTLSSSAPGAGNNIEWFTNPANPAGSVLGAGETYTTAPITTFPYVLYCAEENGGCYGEVTTITIDERGAILAPTAAGTTICNGSSASLTAVSGGTPGVIYWYSDATLTNLAFIGNPFTTPALTATTTYYLVEESFGCVSPASSVTVTVDAAIVDVVGTGAVVCAGQTATLTAVGTGSLEWYSDGAGVNLVGTGNSYETPVLAQTTTFFVTQTSGTCAGNLVPVTAGVTLPPAVTTTPLEICQGDAITTGLEASNAGCSGGGFAPVTDFTGALTIASPTFNRSVSGTIYNASGVGTNVFYNTHMFQVSANGIYNFELCGTTNFVDTYLHLYQNGFNGATPAANFVQANDDGAACYGLASFMSVNLTAGIDYIMVPTTFTNGDVDDYQITFAGPGQVLSGSSGDVVWFDAPVGGTQIGTGSPFNPVGVVGSGLPDTETPGTYTYYVACASNPDCRAEASIVIAPLPDAPVVSGNTEICSGESTLLTAVGVGTITWYSDVTLTTILSTGAQYNTGVLTADVTYWATESFGSCEGESASVTVIVNALPAAPDVTGDTVCVGEVATLSAVGSGGTFEWYTDASGNVSVGSGDTYMTTALTQTTTYYTQETNAEGCLGPITPVIAVVLPQPAAPVVVPVVSFCEAESYTVTATVGLDQIGGTLESTLTNDQGDVIDAQSNLITAITSDITFAGLTPGVYSHFVSVNDGECESLTTEQTIIVNENPDAPLVLDTVTICNGETATLFAFGQNSNPNSIITWYDETILNALAIGWEYETQPLFIDQVYYASITDENGCESELAQIYVVVNNIPTNVTATNDTVCEGDMATLSVSGDDGSTFTWYTDGAGANQVATGSSYITPALAQTTTYYVSETNANNCNSQIVGVTAFIVPAPAEPQASNIILCVGETGQLTATGSGTGQLIWYDGAQVQLEVDDMPPATGTLEVGPFGAAGTYFFYVSETDGNCESQLVEIEVLVGEAPGAPVATADTVCAGQTATLTAAGTGGLLNWYADGALTNLVGVGPQFTTPVLNTTTSYWVTESFGNCEGPSVEVEVVVNPLPATPDVSANTPCEGGTLQLTASNAFGVTYQWNGPSGFSSNLQNPTINDVTEANNQGVYTLSLTDNTTGCVSEVASVVVDIVPIPESPSISNNGPICEGEDLVLTAGIVEGATYTWYDGDDNVIAVTAENTLTISPASLDDAGIYGVSVTVSGCTSSISTTNVQIKATPATPAVSNNGPVCENDQLILITNVVAGATYVWEGPNGVIAQTGPIVSIDPVSVEDAGTYSVYIVVNGCPSEAGTTEVVVVAAPELSQNPTTNSPVCEHETILLQAPYDSTLTYVWSGPNGYVADSVFIDTVNNFYVEAIFDASENDDQGFYTLVVTDTRSGCSSTEYAVLVIVNKFPDAILADNDGPVCEGDDVQLTVTSIFGAEYVWTGPDNFYSTEQNPVVENVDPDVNAGTYEVTIILDGCVSQSATTEVLIYRNPIADAGEDLTILEGTIFQLDGLGSIDAIDFAWVGEDQSYFDDPTRPNPIIGLNGPLPARDEPYVFVLTVYSEFGCTDSDTVLVYIYKTDDLVIPNVITPNGDGANDTWVITYLENLSDYVLSIYARGGSLVYKTTNYNNDWSGVGIKGDDLPAGTYWYSIHGTDTNQEEITFKGYIEIVR